MKTIVMTLGYLLCVGCMVQQKVDSNTQKQIQDIQAEAKLFDQQLTETEASIKRLNKTLDEMNQKDLK